MVRKEQRRGARFDKDLLIANSGRLSVAARPFCGLPSEIFCGCNFECCLPLPYLLQTSWEKIEMKRFSLTDLLESLNEIEADVLNESSTGAEMVARLSSINQRASKLVIEESLDSQTVASMLQAAKRIQIVAAARLKLEEVFGSVCTEALREAKHTLIQESEDPEHRGDVQELSETLPSYHMRKNFLATLDDPYPSQDDKDRLVYLTNTSAPSTGGKEINVHQLTLWFINARRRSGWSTIMQRFARNDRKRMQLLVQAKMLATNLPIRTTPLRTVLHHKVEDVLSDNLGHQLSTAEKKEFEDDWASMISWIKYGVKEKVGSWVHDLVAANKKSGNSPTKKASQSRVVTTAANRSPARKAITSHAKPRQAKQRASKTPSMDSNRDFSALESTPELSMCSTADTSFSSLGSNFSMHYDPFTNRDDVLRSPTLNARASGGRKVKALPKRAHRLAAEALYTSEYPFSPSQFFARFAPLTDLNPF